MFEISLKTLEQRPLESQLEALKLNWVKRKLSWPNLVSFLFLGFCKQFSELLKEDAIVYKLLGPVLVKQDKGEAVSNVKQRSDYMESELKR